MNEFIEHLRKGVVEGQVAEIAFAKEFLKEAGHDKISVEFKKKVLEPIRLESPARCHTFHEVEALGAYLKKYGCKETVILASVAQGIIRCTLNEKAKTGFEIIKMSPSFHPLFSPFKDLPSIFTMKDFAAWIMQHRRVIAQPHGRDLALLLSQIKVSKNITIHEGIGKKSINGIICELDIAGNKKNEAVEIPEEIRLFVPMYVGRDETHLTLDVALSCPREQVMVTVTSPDIKAKIFKEFEQMLLELKEYVDPECVMGLGVVDTVDWNYIDDEDDDEDDD